MIKRVTYELFSWLGEQVDRIRKALPSYLVIFTIGMLIGTAAAYHSINNDCRVLGGFRIGDVPYSCSKPISK